MLETQHPIPEYITNNQQYLVQILSKKQIIQQGKREGVKSSVITTLGHGILLNSD